MNDEGIGYNWLILLIGMIAVIAAFLALQPIFNQVFSTGDEMIADNMMSAQTKTGLDFQRNLITWIPVILLIGGLIYAVYASNAEKASGGYR